MASRLEENLRSILIKDLPLPEPILFPRGTPIRDVLAELSRKRRSGALIHEAGKVVGIFTERDLLMRLTGPGADLSAPIDGVMTPSPRTLLPEDPLAKGIRLMTEVGFRQIPLVDTEGTGVGLLTARRVLMYIADYYPEEVLNLPPRLHQQVLKVEGG